MQKVPFWTTLKKAPLLPRKKVFQPANLSKAKGGKKVLKDFFSAACVKGKPVIRIPNFFFDEVRGKGYY